MGWPEDSIDHATAVGFSAELLPILADAVQSQHVTWVVRPTNSYAVFDYIGYRYTLVYRKDEGTRIEQTARIGVDDDGEDVVVDMAAERSAAAYGNWGEF